MPGSSAVNAADIAITIPIAANFFMSTLRARPAEPQVSPSPRLLRDGFYRVSDFESASRDDGSDRGLIVHIDDLDDAHR
jgi:hypothetical protein